MNAGWTKKKLNIKVRQQTKTLEENVSTLKTENAQLKTASSDKEVELQAAKNLHQSNKSVGSNVSRRGRRLAVSASKPSTTTNPTTIPIVNPICSDQISVSISPFTSSLMTRSGIKRRFQPPQSLTRGQRNKVVAIPRWAPSSHLTGSRMLSWENELHSLSQLNILHPLSGE